MPSVRVIGAGRAGTSVARALAHVGWQVLPLLHRGDDLTGAAAGVDLLVIATPDSAIAEVAATVEGAPKVVVAHLCGSLGIDVLAPHAHRASIHPLAPLPDADRGAARLTSGITFALATSDETAAGLAQQVVADLHGQPVAVGDAQRVAYHAAASIAANHLVALLGQVERVAATAGIPLDAYLPLVRATIDDVERLGPLGALTGPVARGDWETVERHLAAIDSSEHEAYRAMVGAAKRLTEQRSAS